MTKIRKKDVSSRMVRIDGFPCEVMNLLPDNCNIASFFNHLLTDTLNSKFGRDWLKEYYGIEIVFNRYEDHLGIFKTDISIVSITDKQMNHTNSDLKETTEDEDIVRTEF